MLSRIANSLFWMGRYIERAEHLSRYTKVHYFSALDAPQSENKQALLESILHMAGLQEEYLKKYKKVSEHDVIHFISIDKDNPFSILSHINFARENARGARDSITSELWEAINIYYHYIKGYSVKKFNSEATFEFNQKLLDYSSMVKGYIDNTLVHQNEWNIICLGIHLERAIQIIRIILTKIHDIVNVEKGELDQPIQDFHWSVLLKSAESFDMSNRFYKASPTRQNSLEFVILNQSFPKSVAYNIDELHKHLSKITAFRNNPNDPLLFKVGKLNSIYRYTQYEEIEAQTTIFLNDTQNTLNDIADHLDQEYLSF